MKTNFLKILLSGSLTTIFAMANDTQNLQNKISAGEALFKDKSLSYSKQDSCFTCHNVTTHGASNRQADIPSHLKARPLFLQAKPKSLKDHMAVKVGIASQKSQAKPATPVGVENTSTVKDPHSPKGASKNSQKYPSFNTTSVFQPHPKVAYDHIGSAATLHTKIKNELLHYSKMSSSEESIVKHIDQNKNLKTLFLKGYSDVTFENIIDSLVVYIENIPLESSKYELFLQDPQNYPLSKEESQGLVSFKKYACHTCHNGKNFGGNLFQEYPLFGKAPSTLTKKLYRVPSLVNVTRTAPYLHDGSILKLEDAIASISAHQLGVPVSSDETQLIIKFLKTLEKTPQGNK